MTYIIMIRELDMWRELTIGHFAEARLLEEWFSREEKTFPYKIEDWYVAHAQTGQICMSEQLI